ncbi:MAG: hypothetical protein RBG13Loki_3337 [Promethearchaeota archaeon CR_4]|nr:MAG: hypothetical protein RBG13Loki_3337 [Candidatus Lokiarchaeota archaeon CR_4]
MFLSERNSPNKFIKFIPEVNLETVKGDYQLQNHEDFPTIIFVSFENEFAPVGGLNAVMNRLPRQMARMSPEKAILLLTPFFSRIPKSARALEKGAITVIHKGFKVPFRGQESDARLLRYVEDVGGDAKFTMYLLDAPYHFLASENPYINPNVPQGLFEDSCFLCAAVPEVLQIIPEKPPFLLNLQDWETALVSKTLPSSIRHKCVITLHNPYDNSCNMTLHFPGLGDAIHLDPGTLTFRSTVLKQTLPEIRGISTVSDVFARELMNDPLQTKVLAPHLQEVFHEKGVIATTNGIFKDPDPILREILTPAGILEYKNSQRGELTKVFNSKEGAGLLARAWGSCDLNDTTTPLFLLFGRDDPRQKGFDVAAKAIREVLEEKGDIAHFVFTPIPGPRGLGTIAFLEQLSKDFPKSVLVFPFRLSVGYNELQTATSYFLMCSLYEPFGGANEGYASGVPVVARATGGLVQQVCPYNYATLPRDVQMLVDEFHGEKQQPTGFLFKEDASLIPNLTQDWTSIIKAKFLDTNPIGDAILERESIPLYQAMTGAAKDAIIQAIDLFKADPEEYAACVLRGVQLLGKFTWEKAVGRYLNDLYTR